MLGLTWCGKARFYIGEAIGEARSGRVRRSGVRCGVARYVLVTRRSNGQVRSGLMRFGLV